jgi:hypothetical protein
VKDAWIPMEVRRRQTGCTPPCHVIDANRDAEHGEIVPRGLVPTSSEGSEASGPPGFRPILRGMSELWRERRPTLVRVALTIAILVGLWALHDPLGLVFAVILVAAVWLWDR